MKKNYITKRSHMIHDLNDPAFAVTQLNYWRSSYNDWRARLASANKEGDNERKSRCLSGLNKARANLKMYIGAVELYLADFDQDRMAA